MLQNIRLPLAVICASLIAGTASGQSMKEMGQMVDSMMVSQGVAGIIHAQDQCGFTIDTDALNRYLESRDMLTPEAMARIDMDIQLAGYGDDAKLSPTQCSMKKASAKSMGVLAP